MDVNTLESTDWYLPLIDEVERELAQLAGQRHDQGPALLHEHDRLQTEIDGWSQSLAKPSLDPSLRAAIESNWSAALHRQDEIQALLAEQDGQQKVMERMLAPGQVVERLNRLAEVLACNNPTRGNLELAMHLDRIDCFVDGKVVVRTCKLGMLTGVAEILAVHDLPAEGDARSAEGHLPKKSKPRRRARLRTEDGGGITSEEFKAAAYMAADPDRFADLPEKWFWVDEHQMPAREAPWYIKNSEAVYRRRQEAELANWQLAEEFGVSEPTIIRATSYYLETHPEASDFRPGPEGGRPPKIDVSSFAIEARQLWEHEKWSKLRLAEKFGCSTPTIDKALELAYQADGLPMPTKAGRLEMNVLEARRLFNAGHGLEDIAEAMGCSDVTTRKNLRVFFANEGKTMPDLRRRAADNRIRKSSLNSPVCVCDYRLSMGRPRSGDRDSLGLVGGRRRRWNYGLALRSFLRAEPLCIAK